MGGVFGKFSRKRRREMRILMIGLDAAGKTTILYKLKLGEVVSTIPTIGFNTETIRYKKVSKSCFESLFLFWKKPKNEQDEIRSVGYWRSRQDTLPLETLLSPNARPRLCGWLFWQGKTVRGKWDSWEALDRRGAKRVQVACFRQQERSPRKSPYWGSLWNIGFVSFEEQNLVHSILLCHHRRWAFRGSRMAFKIFFSVKKKMWLKQLMRECFKNTPLYESHKNKWILPPWKK